MSTINFETLRETIGDNAHVSGRFNLPNTVMLKFRNGESQTISNANLQKIAEGSFDEDGNQTHKGLGYKMHIVMVPEDKVEEAAPFLTSCNEQFMADLAKDLAENKKVSTGTSTSGNPAEKKAREIIAMVENANKVGMPITNTIDLTEECPEIGQVSIKDGVIENEFVTGVKTKDEENKAKRLEALKKAREEKKAKEAAEESAEESAE